MGAILETYYKLDTLKTLVKTLEAKGEKGINITTSINDEAKKYTNTNKAGESYDTFQNVSSYVSQNKEQRDAKNDKFYVANGAVKWVNDSGVKVAKEAANNVTSDPAAAYGVQSDDLDELPF
jgi:methionine synthase I (cobalamin-dependent)